VAKNLTGAAQKFLIERAAVVAELLNSLVQPFALKGISLGGNLARIDEAIDVSLAKSCSESLPTAMQLDELFAGCTGRPSTHEDLVDCIVVASACSTCRYVASVTVTEMPCDEWDDNALNQSCRQCGNGATEPPEACDDGTETASCDDDCTLPGCSDGNHNAEAGEQCDDGNLTDGDGCNSDCTLGG
jgi:cysteine-rich repeat protein